MLGGAAAWENVDSTAGENFSITEPVTQPCLLLLIVVFDNNKITYYNATLYIIRSSEMAQQVKVLVAKPVHLSLIIGAQIV